MNNLEPRPEGYWRLRRPPPPAHPSLELRSPIKRLSGSGKDDWGVGSFKGFWVGWGGPRGRFDTVPIIKWFAAWGVAAYGKSQRVADCFLGT